MKKIYMLYMISLIWIVSFRVELNANDNLWIRDPTISEDRWEKAAPYFLPIDHQIIPKLDQIFSGSRATLNEKTLKKAGFHFIIRNSKSKHPVVAKHPQIPGYIIKLYLDIYKHKDEESKWIKRIKGARAVKEYILQHELYTMFKVPNKWIYPLPPVESKKYYHKYFILVEDDMYLTTKKKNHQLWKSDVVNEKLLKALYDILTAVRINDGTCLSNIPFSLDRRIAFVDTEQAFRHEVRYKPLLKHLSPDMQTYWLSLISP